MSIHAWRSVVLAWALVVSGCAHETPRLKHHLTGAEATLPSLRGRVVMLNFWAEWCEPCRAELPTLLRAAATYGEDVLFVAVYDGDEDSSRGQVEAWLREQPPAFARQVVWGNTALREKFPRPGVPTTYVLGRDGSVVSVLVGAIESPAHQAQLHKVLRFALAETRGSRPINE